MPSCSRIAARLTSSPTTGEVMLWIVETRSILQAAQQRGLADELRDGDHVIGALDRGCRPSAEPRSVRIVEMDDQGNLGDPADESCQEDVSPLL